MKVCWWDHSVCCWIQIRYTIQHSWIYWQWRGKRRGLGGGVLRSGQVIKQLLEKKRLWGHTWLWVSIETKEYAPGVHRNQVVGPGHPQASPRHCLLPSSFRNSADLDSPSCIAPHEHAIYTSFTPHGNEYCPYLHYRPIHNLVNIIKALDSPYNFLWQPECANLRTGRPLVFPHVIRKCVSTWEMGVVYGCLWRS